LAALENTYIIDNTANMKLATKDQSRLGCAGHNLNLVLAHSLKEQSADVDDAASAEPDFMSDVVQLITVC